MRSDRIVLPIPPGTHWDDAKPSILPGLPWPGETPALPAPRTKRAKAAKATPVAPVRPPEVSSGGFWFAPASAMPAVEALPAKRTDAPAEKRAKAKNDPRLVAAARELRDRWLEEMNARRHSSTAAGKYDVTRLPSPSARVPAGLPGPLAT